MPRIFDNIDDHLRLTGKTWFIKKVLDEARHNETKIEYGPDNPHPLSTLKTELVRDGKYDECGKYFI